MRKVSQNVIDHYLIAMRAELHSFGPEFEEALLRMLEERREKRKERKS